MTSRHSSPTEAPTPSLIARTIRVLAVPIILGWIALTVVVNVVAPSLDKVGAAHSVAMTARDAPSTIAMMRIGKDFQQFDSDTTAMVLLEGQDRLGDEAHRFYDKLIDKLSQDTTHIEHINNFWGDPLTAAGSQSTDAKSAYVQLNLRGDQGSTQANNSVAAVQRIVDSVPPPPRIKAYVTGPGPLAADRREYGDKGIKRITAVTLVVIAVMLLVVYRSISTALVMLLTLGIELQVSKGVIAVLANSNLIGLSTFAVNLLVALAIAASTDYVIFWVGRYQEGRSRGLDREAAYYNMFSGTAHVIVGSGLTVAGAMACLSFCRLPYFQTLGAPCSLGLLVVLAASMTLGPAIVAVVSRFGVLDPKRAHRERGWRRVGTAVVRWPGPVLAATATVALVGLLALPAYTTNYNDRYYIPGFTPANVGYHASDRHFPQARMEPELLMVESDHDMRNPADMIVLDKVAKNVFHIPGIARVQDITRPLGTPIDHSSVPFQISLQAANIVENLQYLHDAVANLTKVSDQLEVTIDITTRISDLTHQLTGVTHDLDGQTHQIKSDTNDLRDHIADFDDFWRPLRSYFYWEKHCFDIPMCWSFRSLFDGLDSVDTLSDDIGNITKDIDRLDVILPQLDALLPQLTVTLKTVRALTMAATSIFAGLIKQQDALSKNSTFMGKAFDDSHNDDTFFLAPEAFENPDFQRGLKLFLSPDGKSAQYIVTHKGDPATPDGISHIDKIIQAASEAVKGTPLEGANLYLGGTAATYKDMHDGSMFDLMIADHRVDRPYLHGHARYHPKLDRLRGHRRHRRLVAGLLLWNLGAGVATPVAHAVELAGAADGDRDHAGRGIGLQPAAGLPIPGRDPRRTEDRHHPLHGRHRRRRHHRRAGIRRHHGLDAVQRPSHRRPNRLHHHARTALRHPGGPILHDAIDRCSAGTLVLVAAAGPHPRRPGAGSGRPRGCGPGRNPASTCQRDQSPRATMRLDRAFKV